MIYKENDFQIKWENIIRQKFGTFPVNLNNAGNLSIDEAIGFERAVSEGTDPYELFRVNKFEELLGIPPIARGAAVRESDFLFFLIVKYGIINIAPENRQDYWRTPEGSAVFSKIATELGDKMIPDLDYN